jgi:hypothetical protein
VRSSSASLSVEAAPARVPVARCSWTGCQCSVRMQYVAAEEGAWTQRPPALYPGDLVQQELAKASSEVVRLGDLGAGLALGGSVHEAPLSTGDGRHAGEVPWRGDGGIEQKDDEPLLVGSSYDHDGATWLHTQPPQEDDEPLLAGSSHDGATWLETQPLRELQHTAALRLPVGVHTTQTGFFFQPQQDLTSYSARPAGTTWAGLFAESPLQHQPIYQPQYQQLQQQPLQQQPPQLLFTRRPVDNQSSLEQLDAATFLSQYKYVEQPERVPTPRMHGESEVWTAGDSEE